MGRGLPDATSTASTRTTVLLVTRLRDRVNVVRLARYSVASVAASLISAAVLWVGNKPLGTHVATIGAFVGGAAVAFMINRFWAWKRADKRVQGGEFVRYWLVAAAAALIALGCTSGMHAILSGSSISDVWQTFLIICAYFGSYAVTFVGKYLLLGRFVFTSGRIHRGAIKGTANSPTVSDVVAEVESGA